MKSYNLDELERLSKKTNLRRQVLEKKNTNWDQNPMLMNPTDGGVSEHTHKTISY